LNGSPQQINSTKNFTGHVLKLNCYMEIIIAANTPVEQARLKKMHQAMELLASFGAILTFSDTKFVVESKSIKDQKNSNKKRKYIENSKTVNQLPANA
jgi:hypothetical protein